MCKTEENQKKDSDKYIHLNAVRKIGHKTFLSEGNQSYAQ